MNIADIYLNVIQDRFNSVKKLGDKTIAQLNHEQLHWSINEESNSIAIIVKHLSGNMISRWTDFLTTDGEKQTRNRDDEFYDTLMSKDEIIAVWEKGWQVLFKALRELTEKNLLEFVTIRGERHTVIEAIERQMAHYALHVGQIVYIGKQLKGEQWNTLSIARGQSDVYTDAMLKKHR